MWLHSDQPTIKKNLSLVFEYSPKSCSQVAVLFWNRSVRRKIFCVNFLSSRKYDWNVAPTDLEKYGAPTAHASYFFKKNKSLFTQLLLLNNKTNKRIKSIFQLVFYFISCYYYYNKAINTVFYFNCLLFTITFIWKVSRKIFQKYTKSFGGKIWANLHSVSTDNDFSAKYNKIFL